MGGRHGLGRKPAGQCLREVIKWGNFQTVWGGPIGRKLDLGPATGKNVPKSGSKFGGFDIGEKLASKRWRKNTQEDSEHVQRLPSVPENLS